MADIANIFGIESSPWDLVVGKWQRGEEPDKAEVLRLLESSDPIPEKAHPLLAGLIDGTVKARRGLKPSKISRLMRREIARTAASMVTMLKDPDRVHEDYGKEFRDWLRAARMKRGAGTVSEKAKRLTAELCGVTERTVKDCVTEYRAQLRRIADERGVPIATVERAVRYGDP